MSVRVAASVVSAGTEWATLEAAHKVCGRSQASFPASSTGPSASVEAQISTASALSSSGRKRRRFGVRTQDTGFSAQFTLIAAVLSERAEAPRVEGYLVSTLATLAAARSPETGAVESVVDDPSDLCVSPPVVVELE